MFLSKKLTFYFLIICFITIKSDVKIENSDEKQETPYSYNQKDKVSLLKKIMLFFKEDDFIRILRKICKISLSTYFILKFVLPDFELIGKSFSNKKIDIQIEQKYIDSSNTLTCSLSPAILIPFKVIGFALTQWLLI
jgi:hypothetical protein